MSSELREYSLTLNLKSGAVVKTDLQEVADESVIANVAAAINSYVSGDDGVFLYPVNEDLTYIPYRNVEFVALEYVTSSLEEDTGETADSSYMFVD